MYGHRIPPGVIAGFIDSNFQLFKNILQDRLNVVGFFATKLNSLFVMPWLHDY